jgi:RNA polymerase primary sigma factor
MSFNGRVDSSIVERRQHDLSVRSGFPDAHNAAPEPGRGCPRGSTNRRTRESQRRVPASLYSERAHRLSASEERELSRRIKSGDTAAQHQLVTANLALVLGAVRAFERKGVPRDDLVQEGMIGLVRAANNFDPSAHTARFATYAKFWIQSALVRALATGGSLIQIPKRSSLLRCRYHRAIDELRGRAPAGSGPADSSPPSLDEIARQMGVPARQLDPLTLTRGNCAPFQTIVEQISADDSPLDDDSLDDEQQATLNTAVRKLSPFEAWVIRERYGLRDSDPRPSAGTKPRRWTAASHTTGREPASRVPGAAPAKAGRPSPLYYNRTYSEIGRDCGMSMHRIHQVERSAIAKLRDFLAQEPSEQN